MGYRCTLCSMDYDGDLPEWFKDKYKNIVLFPSGLLVVSKREAKYYTNEFFKDYQKAINESGFWNDCDLTITTSVLGESGVITKVEINKNSIKYFWMFDGDENENIYSIG